jgi:hypothetical protein
VIKIFGKFVQKTEENKKKKVKFHPENKKTFQSFPIFELKFLLKKKTLTIGHQPP